MKQLNLIAFAAVLLMTASCSTTNYNERALIGTWFSQGWLREGAETGITAWFEFNEDKTYRAVIARTQEQGTWWVDGYKLYTHADGQEEIVVKIEHLEGSSLELGMNRGGQMERIILAKGN
jgi:hypothetical protein